MAVCQQSRISKKQQQKYLFLWISQYYEITKIHELNREFSLDYKYMKHTLDSQKFLELFEIEN